MDNKSNKKWFVISLVCIVIILSCICTLALSNNKANKQEEIIKVHALTLEQEYNDNEVAADQKYKDKWVYVFGTVQDIGKILNKSYITLEGKETTLSLSSAQCSFKGKNSEPIGSINKGDKVIVYGKCTGKVLCSVMFDDCQVAPQKEGE
ncbi:hypothetical protein MHBO_002833 [Bonamia ostreae]|uniref:tRNA_anti-like n=1 Tax=Bonamia ostreae TaxID=126728 RepID=A0ABV2ANN6_9EUKA